jgi:hypothetical protein
VFTRCLIWDARTFLASFGDVAHGGAPARAAAEVPHIAWRGTAHSAVAPDTINDLLRLAAAHVPDDDLNLQVTQSTVDSSQTQGRVAPPDAPLGPIESTRINTSFLRSIDRDGLNLFDLIEDTDTFKGLFLPEAAAAPRAFRPKCALSEANVDTLLLWGTSRKVARCLWLHPTFLVWKSNQRESRLIVNCRQLNSVQVPTPDMMLPDARLLLARMAAYPIRATVDVKSAFYQFALHEAIQNYFAFRGKKYLYAVTVLCMGWKFAPAICQRAFTILTRELMRRVPGLFADVWVDNIALAAPDEAAMTTGLAVLHELCDAEHGNIKLHDVVGLGEASLTLLGIEFHKDGSLGFTGKWLERVAGVVAPLLERPDATVREWAQALGLVTWSNYVRGVAYATWPALRQLGSDIGKAAGPRPPTAGRVLRGNNVWDGRLTGPPAVIQELRAWMALLSVRFLPAPLMHDRVDVENIYTDASDLVCAWASGAAAWSEAVEDVFVEHRIFIKELAAAVAALQGAAWRGQACALVHTDNMACVYALRSGRSTSRDAEALIRRLHATLPATFEWSVAWVPTSANTADMYTRGVPASSKPPAAVQTAARTWYEDLAVPAVNVKGHGWTQRAALAFKAIRHSFARDPKRDG